MNLVQTKSFKLAIYSQGDPRAEKLALVLPGKLDTKDYAHMRSHVDFLAKKGFFALSFDPPGTWESEGDISLYTMTNYLKAINEVIEYYGNKPTFVMGHSRGATMAIIATLRNPLVTSFAAVFSSLRADGSWSKSDEKKWKEQGYMISMRDLPPGGGEEVKEFKLSYGFYEDQLQYNVSEEIKHSNKPKLFFLGEHDNIAKPEIIREFYGIASEPKELHELDSDHDYRFHEDLINEVNDIMGKFLTKFNI